MAKNKRPTLAMLALLKRLDQGGRVQWNAQFGDSPDANNKTVAALLHRRLVKSQPGTAALALTEKGRKALEARHAP
ncbi:hypothetical protein LJC15_00035 [Desulfovibrio sp. OttesenSCG-928-G11]|nr:hypothetical protein [Desulfovibrio sp. OttesenSCG-928-G11]